MKKFCKMSVNGGSYLYFLDAHHMHSCYLVTCLGGKPGCGSLHEGSKEASHQGEGLRQKSSSSNMPGFPTSVSSTSSLTRHVFLILKILYSSLRKLPMVITNGWMNCLAKNGE